MDIVGWLPHAERQPSHNRLAAAGYTGSMAAGVISDIITMRRQPNQDTATAAAVGGVIGLAAELGLAHKKKKREAQRMAELAEQARRPVVRNPAGRANRGSRTVASPRPSTQGHPDANRASWMDPQHVAHGERPRASRSSTRLQKFCALYKNAKGEG